MRSLTSQDCLSLWENGLIQHPLDRAITWLAMALPDKAREDLAELSIGQRDMLLFQLRRQTFGRTIAGFTICPACSLQLEFDVDLDAILASVSSHKTPQEVVYDGYTITFRLPNSRDFGQLITAAGHDPRSHRVILLHRCITHSPVPIEEIPGHVLDEIESVMSQSDPHADIQFELGCVDCGIQWQQPFDMASFLWSEICAEAKQALEEVHLLARAYGWREGEILSMSRWRRQAYLEMTYR